MAYIKWHFTPVGQNVKKQKSSDIPLCMVTVQHVKMTANTQADVARLSAVSSTHARDYLNIYPSSSVGTKLDDSSLHIAIALRLGTQICVGGDPVDSSGTHGLSYRMSADRLARHAAVNDFIKRALSSTEVPSRLERTIIT